MVDYCNFVINELNPTFEVQNMGNGAFQMHHLLTPCLQTTVFQTVITVASGLKLPKCMNFNDDGLLADANRPANHVIYFMFQWLSFASLQQAASTVVDFRVVNFIRNAHSTDSTNFRQLRKPEYSSILRIEL